MKNKLIFLFIVSLLFVNVVSLGVNAKHCTAIVVGKDATVDGSVLNAHIEDSWWDQNLRVVPGQTFEPGAMADIMLNKTDFNQKFQIEGEPNFVKIGEIPQVEETYTYLDIAFPFMNEHQVFFADQSILGRSELFNSEGLIPEAQLMAFALQRAKTAREAIKVIGGLAEQYGWGESRAECLLVTDSDEAWHFEIYGSGADWTPDSGKPGALWVAQRVPDDHVSVNCNRSNVGEIDLDNPDYFMASTNIFSLAEEMGWYDPEAGEPFIFYEVYAPHDRTIRHSRREWRIYSWLAPSQNFSPYPGEKRYPFSVKPDEKVSVQDLMAIQRDFFEGTEFDLTKGMAAGPFGNPNRDFFPDSHLPEDLQGLTWERAISLNLASYYSVGVSRNWLPDHIGGLMWFGLDQTATSCPVPFYCGITEVPESYSTGRRDIFDKDCAWWAFNFVSNWANLKWSYMIEDINEARDYLLDDMFTMQPFIEETALKIYQDEPSLAASYLTDYSVNTANKVVDYWWKLAETLIAKYDDGFISGPEGDKKPGYPEWWLREVGYGEKY